jgi:glycosyltransferase involved in cell wall biosynthesis
MIAFSARCMWTVLRKAAPGDRIVTVTTPAALPYAVTLAARLKRTPVALVLYDLYPDVLVAAGVAREGSVPVRINTWLNRWMYHRLERVVVIGEDMRRRLRDGLGVPDDKIALIPNWVDIDEAAVEALSHRENPVRARLPRDARFVVGLSGNLGFVHDPDTVLEAARRMRDEPGLHFLLSGWGVGWERIKAAQAADRLPNVTLVEKVPHEELVALLGAADVWLVPYRRGMSGVSVPSRFYNLLAVGRPIITLAEPDADHSVTILENGIGWVVPPEAPEALVTAIREASADPAASAAKGQRARALVAKRYSYRAAAEAYRAIARGERPAPT